MTPKQNAKLDLVVKINLKIRNFLLSINKFKRIL